MGTSHPPVNDHPQADQTGTAVPPNTAGEGTEGGQDIQGRAATMADGREVVADRDVHEACDRLAIRGEKITLRLVRAELGHGSFTRLGRGIAAWKDKQTASTASAIVAGASDDRVAALAKVAPEVVELIRDQVRQVSADTLRIAEESRRIAEADRAAVLVENEQLEQSLDVAKAENSELRHALNAVQTLKEQLTGLETVVHDGLGVIAGVKLLLQSMVDADCDERKETRVMLSNFEDQLLRGLKASENTAGLLSAVVDRQDRIAQSVQDLGVAQIEAIGGIVKRLDDRERLAAEKEVEDNRADVAEALVMRAKIARSHRERIRRESAMRMQFTRRGC